MFAGPAGAFTFADGAKAVCIARGEIVTEIDAEPGDPFKPHNRTALAERTADGWRITWNLERLHGLPPEVRDFLFFHECAHARVPTENELEANCAGLLDMRAAGRAGPAFEAKLRGFFPRRQRVLERHVPLRERERPEAAGAPACARARGLTAFGDGGSIAELARLRAKARGLTGPPNARHR